MSKYERAWRARRGQPGLVLVTDRMQGVDCPLCEDGGPHEHGPLDASVLSGSLAQAGADANATATLADGATSAPVTVPTPTIEGPLAAGARVERIEDPKLEARADGRQRHCSRCGSTEHTKSKCTVTDAELEKLTAPDAKVK